MHRHALIQREWQHLFDRFARRLLELAPRSVLDVGCGRGQLVNELTRRGIPATGVDQAAPGDDPQLIRADAAALPFPDDAFEWAVMRHVPHHLADLPGALGECARVARVGLLIAEPWFDLDDPAQRISERWDRWCKRRHESAGRVHRPCIPLTGLAEALPPGDHDVTADHYGRRASIPVPVIEAMSQPLLDELPPADPDREEYAEVMGGLHEHGFTYNGTLIVTVGLHP